MKTKRQIWFILLACLTACALAPPDISEIQTQAILMTKVSIALTQTALPTATPPLPTITPTATSVLILPTPPPTQPHLPILTPDAILVERWKEYQTELARVVLSSNLELVHAPYKDALCEWDILGRSGQEVYVYAVCVVANGIGDMRTPAIIYLEPDGSIRKVKLPEPKGTSLIYDYDLFPTDVQEKFCYYFDPFPSDLPPCPYRITYPLPRLDVLYAHIEYRKTHPHEPPLVVLSAMPTTTPTP